MDFPNEKVLLISRLDGNRGPLGVAAAVHSRLAQNHACKLAEIYSFADVLKLIVKIPFTYKGYSICVCTKMDSEYPWRSACYRRLIAAITTTS